MKDMNGTTHTKTMQKSINDLCIELVRRYFLSPLSFWVRTSPRWKLMVGWHRPKSPYSAAVHEFSSNASWVSTTIGCVCVCVCVMMLKQVHTYFHGINKGKSPPLSTMILPPTCFHHFIGREVRFRGFLWKGFFLLVSFLKWEHKWVVLFLKIPLIIILLLEFIIIPPKTLFVQ